MTLQQQYLPQNERQLPLDDDDDENGASSFASQLVRSAQNDSKARRKSSILALARSRSASLLQQKEEHRSTSKLKTSTGVYIQDEAYSWLPANFIRYCDEQKTKAEVSIVLPSDWHAQTVLSVDSTILDLEEGTAKSLTRVVSLSDYPNQELPLQNIESSTTSYNANSSKRDMADLPHLHEAAILYNLKERHATHHPYTRVGDIVVAMNPFVWMDQLYRKETRDLYAKNLVWSHMPNPDGSDNNDDEEDEDDAFTQYTKLGFDPHVYETSCLAYRGLLKNEGNQTILVTGESGAGKTETVKIVMQHLATLVPEQAKGTAEDDEDETHESVVKRVLESNPVFEAFGNAKTLRNDNSSRFGKFTQLQFSVQPKRKKVEPPTDQEDGTNEVDESGTSYTAFTPPLLAGSICHTYLLEKSRVVSHSKGERNYHIFYQLMRAPNEMKRNIWNDLEDTDLESFLYLGDNNEYNLLGGGRGAAGCVDEEEWPQTLEALAVFDFKDGRLTTLLRALCAVLQLGNIVFVEDPASHETEEGGTVVSSQEELMKLQDILGIPTDLLEQCMTTRLLKTGYDEVHVRLSPSVAKDSTDALAKEIYARIFDVLVKSINEYTQGRTYQDKEAGEGIDEGEGQSATKTSEYGVICLLDIFGFERFHVNRFEQLCINYANEHLQHKYVLDNFRAVQEEYVSEGIELFDFAVVDNSDVLNLLENRLGILISLNEECVRPKGNDESFVYKIKIVNKDNDRMIDKKLHLKTEFGIRHFAGPVTYDATKFVERNMDKLPEDLIHCVSQSTNKLISSEFQRILEDTKSSNTQEAKSPGKRKTTSKTVIQKFRLQLKGLMDNIHDTTTRYIRCIKPNESMTPRMMDHYTTMRQLECAGLVTAITISRETFPNRLGYDATRERFVCLMTAEQAATYNDLPNEKEAVRYMLSNLLHPTAEEAQLYSGESSSSSSNDNTKFAFACGNTRVYFRAGALEFLETKRLDYYTKRVILIQNWIRQLQAQERYFSMRTAAIQIQRIARGHLEWRRYQFCKLASIRLAAWIRGRQASALVQRMREEKAAVQIQSTWRTVSEVHQLSRMKAAAVVIQRAVRNKEKRDHVSSKLAVAVQEARMDNKLLGLKKGIGGRQVNAELLREVESMFDYLRGEIFTLRESNSEMKVQLRLADEEKRELETRVETAEAAATASRLQGTSLVKSSSKLSKVIEEYKHETTGLKKQIKALESQRTEQVESVKIDYDRLLHEKDEEIAELKKKLVRVKKESELGMMRIQQHATKVEEGNVTEILRLKDELRRTQESHHDYLAKLMDVLETTHQAREQETARIAHELLVVKEEKDTQIRDLQHEVETLRRIKRAGSGPPAAASSIERKVNEVASIRRDLERNSSARRQRSQKFMEVASRLTEAISPENLVAITSARRARGKTVSVVEEETMRMKQMIRFLGDLYNLEESSQGKADEEFMKSMDAYMAALAPDTAMMKMELMSQQLTAENKQLKAQVSAQGQCPRCDARDKRRRNRNRTNRSPARSHDGSSDGLNDGMPF